VTLVLLFCGGSLGTTSTTTTTEKTTATGVTSTTDLTSTAHVSTTTDVTTTVATTGNTFVAIFNQALSIFDSASIYIQPISNFIFGFMLIKMFVNENDRGCKLPTGLEVQNGWHELSSDCQEECFCMRNKFYCRSKPCDLNENQCVLDAFGGNFCYPVDTTGSFGTDCTCENLNCTEPGTTITPNTTIGPTFAIDRVIDIQANQQVGTIGNYYQNYEFSLEVRLDTLTPERGTYTDSSIAVGEPRASRGQGEALMMLYHGYNINSQSYCLWFNMHGSEGDGRWLPNQNFTEWHQIQLKQLTDDGIDCTQEIKLNGETIWVEELTCPPKFEKELNIHMCGDDERVLDGQIRNFKFFTHDL